MGYKWDRDTIIRHIQRRAIKGRSVKASDIRREVPNLYYAAKYYFGSYRAALVYINGQAHAADLTDYSASDGRWDKERVIYELLKRYEEGSDLSFTKVRSEALGKNAKRLFGSWKAAVEASGIDYVEVRRYGWGAARVSRIEN